MKILWEMICLLVAVGSFALGLGTAVKGNVMFAWGWGVGVLCVVASMALCMAK